MEMEKIPAKTHRNGLGVHCRLFIGSPRPDRLLASSPPVRPLRPLSLIHLLVGQARSSPSTLSLTLSLKSCQVLHCGLPFQ